MSTDDLMPDFVGILHVLANTDRLSDNERWACSRGATELRKAKARCDRLLAALSDTEMGEEEAAEIAAEVRAEMEDR